MGGVAISKGDFRCTRMVDRCLVAGEEVPDVGEKVAVVGGKRSSLDFPGPVSGPVPDPRAGDEFISTIQGVSDLCQSRHYGGERRRINIPNAAMQTLTAWEYWVRSTYDHVVKVSKTPFPATYDFNQVIDRVIRKSTSK